MIKKLSTVFFFEFSDRHISIQHSFEVLILLEDPPHQSLFIRVGFSPKPFKFPPNYKIINLFPIEN